jgi:Bacterial SH3 domain
MKKLLWLIPLFIVFAAHAESVFVTDRLSVALKTAPNETGAVVKQLDAGAPLDVVERTGLWAHVRDRAGADGWIESRFLTAEAPARAQLADSQAQLAKARAQLADAQAQLRKSETALAQESAKVKDLQKTTAATPPAPAPAPPPAPEAEAPKPVPAEMPHSDAQWMPAPAWLATCFAMLVIGFLSGKWWLRESIRRRSGGMYIRV